MPLTDYKVGDKIYGNGDWILHVKSVNADQSITVGFTIPKAQRHFYSINGGAWVTLPSELKLTTNCKVTLKIEDDDFEYKWIQPWSWFGNKHDADTMRYGRNPYTYIDAGSLAQPRPQTSAQFLTGSGYSSTEWELVPGTYTWDNTLKNGDWQGWIKGEFFAVILNHYKRPVRGQIRRKKPKIISRSMTINVTKIKVLPDPIPPDIDIYDKNNSNFRISTGNIYKRNVPVKVSWSEDTNEFTYTITNTTFKSWSASSASSYSIGNGQTLTNPGTYTITVTEKNKKTGLKDVATATIQIIDATPPSVEILDKNNNNYVIPDAFPYERDKSVKVWWKEDTATVTHTVSNTTFKGWQDNTASPTSIKRDQVLSNFGIYTLTVTEKNISTGKTDTSTVEIHIVNPKPPLVRIYDLNNNKTVIPEDVPYKRTSSVKVNWDEGPDEFNTKVTKEEYRPWTSNTFSFKDIKNNQVLSDFGIYHLTVEQENISSGAKDSSTVEIQIIDPTPPSIKITDANNNNAIIPEIPAEYTRNVPVKVVWKEDTTKFKYTITDGKYTDIEDNTNPYNITNGTTLTKYGTYEVTVTEESISSGQSDTITVQINIEDPVPPPALKIYDATDTTIIYDMTNKVFLGPCFPTVDIPPLCILEQSVINGDPYTLGEGVSEDNTYAITVSVRKTTNNKISTISGLFTIDNKPPSAPIIKIDKDYQGKDFGLVGKFPNPVSPTITCETGCKLETKVFFKNNLWETEWKEITAQQTYSNRGIYRIESKAKKLKNGLYSDMTAVEFYKKVKYRYSITLNPNDLCYRTIATVNFPNDPLMKFMYKIGDGEWRFYRDPVKIYNNTIMYVKSLDGDDDYESYITSKVIDIIDKEPPEPPVIGGVSEGDVGTVFVPTIVK